MLSIWLACFMLTLLVIRLQYVFHSFAAIPSIILVVITSAICCLPFHFFYSRARFQLLKTLGNIFISPFGLVRFRHFFLADVITSMVGTLQDIGYVGCFYLTPRWETSSSPMDCKGQDYWHLGIAFIPYHFRFWQCLNKYHETKMFTHLVNAGKYFSCLLIQFTNIFKGNTPGLYSAYMVHFIATVYCYAWDLYMDWGLLRSQEPGRKFLRHKLLYPRNFYYWAIFSNMILRFFWLLSLMPASFFNETFENAQAWIFIADLAEGIRRTQWALIRVENENINNFEKYRTILQIPSVKDQEEEVEEALQASAAAKKK